MSFEQLQPTLGPNLVPDYLTSVKDGGFYGWPYSYYGQHVDPCVQPQQPELAAKAIAPDYALSSHVAPLDLAFNTSAALPPAYAGGAFIVSIGVGTDASSAAIKSFSCHSRMGVQPEWLRMW